MGNQARQNQELELWQVVSSSGNTRTRQAGAGRAGAQVRSDMYKRGNGSNRRRTGMGNVRASGTVRTRSARPPVRMENTRPAGSGNMRRAGAGRTEYARASGAVRRADARTVRTAYIGTVRSVRPADPRMRAKTQPSGKRKTGRRSQISQFLALTWIVLMCAAVAFMGKALYQGMHKPPVMKADKPENPSVSKETPAVDDIGWKPDIREDFLTISEYNRPGTKLACVKNIFVHYTANPKTSAAQNRSYFENLGQTHERAASAHFIIGYEGEIIQCIPLEEEAYAVVERNGDSVSIECCYLEEDGSFTQETYDSLVEMLAWLLDKYDLQPQDILRHYDCGGKLCPLYYVKHEDAWQQLLDDVAHYTR